MALAAVPAVLLTLAAAGSASAAERWSLRGAGWGHGIGMSQYGAYGLAKHGASYREILRHYYTGTALEQRTGGTVRVLLAPNRSTVAFRGASRAGTRRLRPESTYRTTRSGSEVVLRSPRGRPLARFDGLMRVTGKNTVKLIGGADNGVREGLYRGALEVRIARGPGLNAINALSLEDYVAGVVGNESPSSWPAAALRAQAVAARTYALATGVGGRGFDQYADTRSQVYRGALSETPSTNSAVAQTSGEVVTYGGETAVTYFFSTSGGYTENVENVFSGSDPKPWLKGVEDPYDDASPYHRWGPFTYSRRGIAARLGSWVKGSFERFEIAARGVSPRVVRARVVGSGGRASVTGAQVRARLGLRDTWFYVRRVSSRADGGAQARTSSGERPVVALSGSVSGGGDTVKLQRREAGSWRTVMPVPLVRSGGEARYRIHVGRPGRYRVLAGWAPGPAVTVRP